MTSTSGGRGALRALLLCLLVLANASTRLHLQSPCLITESNVLVAAKFCHGCKDPSHEGSLVYALRVSRSISEFDISAEAVYVVPNHVNSTTIFNKNQLVNKIAIVERGEVPIADKMRKAQEAGAVAVLILDDGQCDEDFTFCGHRAGSVAEGGFSPYDSLHSYFGIYTPALVLSKKSGERLRAGMDLDRIKLAGFGMQWLAKPSHPHPEL